MSDEKTPFSVLAEHIGGILTTLLSASVIGVISLAIMTYQQAIEISHINESVRDMHATLEELKHRSITADVRLSMLEETSKKLQTDMEDVKYDRYDRYRNMR